ncbi:MAG TPA: type II toxin-antitoxin system prevent-host-death family antitoxin [Chloroflexota bacterium]|nr:type II toxin-antitoxin system prevent-host-death family antitoxin [Chloroflexota bacterium]
MREIGVRALRLELSRVLASAQAGETVVVTRAGVPIARIGPVKPPLPPTLRALIDDGRATWEGVHPPLPDPAPLVGTGPSVADLLLEQRGSGAVPRQ